MPRCQERFPGSQRCLTGARKIFTALLLPQAFCIPLVLIVALPVVTQDRCADEQFRFDVSAFRCERRLFPLLSRNITPLTTFPRAPGLVCGNSWLCPNFVAIPWPRNRNQSDERKRQYQAAPWIARTSTLGSGTQRRSLACKLRMTVNP